MKDCHFCSKSSTTIKKALKLCQRCHAVRYCSKECQTADWLQHKLVCVRIGPGEKAVRDRLNPNQEVLQAAMVEAHRCQRAGDRKGEAIALSRMGKTFIVLGQVENGMEAHEKCLAIGLELGDSSLMRRQSST